MRIWSWKKCFLTSLRICGFYLLVIPIIWWLFGWEIGGTSTNMPYIGLIIYPNWLWVPMSTFYVAVCTIIIGRLTKIDYQKFYLIATWPTTIGIIVLVPFGMLTSSSRYVDIFFILLTACFFGIFLSVSLSKSYPAALGAITIFILISGLSSGLVWATFFTLMVLMVFGILILAENGFFHSKKISCIIHWLMGKNLK
jgi:hypothetical protein